MKNVQFGCGGNPIPGWENYDSDVDITKPLPFESNSCDLVFAEHLLEHIPTNKGYLFLEECVRILVPGGQLGIIVPDPTKLEGNITPKYVQFFVNMGMKPNPVRCCMTEFGHQAAWTKPLLETVFRSLGLSITTDEGRFKGCSGHAKFIGEEFNAIDSVTVIGEKS